MAGFVFAVCGGEVFEEEFEGALRFVGVELGGRGEEAVLGVVDHLGDKLGGLFARVGFGKVEAGDLEAIEEKTGAARVDFVGGDAAENLADGLLDRAAVLGVREGEAGLAALAGGGVLDGAAGAVVEVAEGWVRLRAPFGVADGWAAAAAAVGEDVAALELFGLGCDDFWCHRCRYPLPGVFAQNLEMIWVSGGP